MGRHSSGWGLQVGLLAGRHSRSGCTGRRDCGKGIGRKGREFWLYCTVHNDFNPLVVKGWYFFQFLPVLPLIPLIPLPPFPMPLSPYSLTSAMW